GARHGGGRKLADALGVGDRLSAVGYRLSAIGYQLSVISYQLSVIADLTVIRRLRLEDFDMVRAPPYSKLKTQNSKSKTHYQIQNSTFKPHNPVTYPRR